METLFLLLILFSILHELRRLREEKREPQEEDPGWDDYDDPGWDDYYDPGWDDYYDPSWDDYDYRNLGD